MNASFSVKNCCLSKLFRLYGIKMERDKWVVSMSEDLLPNACVRGHIIGSIFIGPGAIPDSLNQLLPLTCPPHNSATNLKKDWRFSYPFGSYFQSVLGMAVIATDDFFRGFIMKGHWKRTFAWLTCLNLQGMRLESLAFEIRPNHQSSASN